MGLRVAGVDEAGRGPLAGSVFAAAVILNPEVDILGLDDSKKLSPNKRARCEEVIKSSALDWCVAEASVGEIDDLNILYATMLAMRRALEGLSIKPDSALIDGNRLPESLPCNALAVVGGDGIHAEISAASILAKEARDRSMRELASRFPGYGFEKHKGYPTKMHMDALQRLGVTPYHRRSFAPVRRLIAQGETEII